MRIETGTGLALAATVCGSDVAGVAVFPLTCAGLRVARASACGSAVWRNGADYVLKILCFATDLHREILVLLRDAFDRRVEFDRAPVLAYKLRGRLRKQRRQIAPCQQQVARGATAAEAVAQHIEEHLCGAAYHRRVECCDTQRRP